MNTSKRIKMEALESLTVPEHLAGMRSLSSEVSQNILNCCTILKYAEQKRSGGFVTDSYGNEVPFILDIRLPFLRRKQEKLITAWEEVKVKLRNHPRLV